MVLRYFLLLFVIPYTIIWTDLSERAGKLWNICLVQKQRANGAFLKDEYRNYVRETAYRAFQNLVVCG